MMFRSKPVVAIQSTTACSYVTLALREIRVELVEQDARSGEDIALNTEMAFQSTVQEATPLKTL